MDWGALGQGVGQAVDTGGDWLDRIARLRLAQQKMQLDALSAHDRALIKANRPGKAVKPPPSWWEKIDMEKNPYSVSAVLGEQERAGYGNDLMAQGIDAVGGPPEETRPSIEMGDNSGRTAWNQKQIDYQAQADRRPQPRLQSAQFNQQMDRPDATRGAHSLIARILADESVKSPAAGGQLAGRLYDVTHPERTPFGDAEKPGLIQQSITENKRAEDAKYANEMNKARTMIAPAMGQLNELKRQNKMDEATAEYDALKQKYMDNAMAGVDIQQVNDPQYMQHTKDYFEGLFVTQAGQRPSVSGLGQRVVLGHPDRPAKAQADTTGDKMERLDRKALHDRKKSLERQLGDSRTRPTEKARIQKEITALDQQLGGATAPTPAPAAAGTPNEAKIAETMKTPGFTREKAINYLQSTGQWVK